LADGRQSSLPRRKSTGPGSGFEISVPGRQDGLGHDPACGSAHLVVPSVAPFSLKLGIVLSHTPPETFFNARRLANYSLKQGDIVKIFLVGQGVEIDRIADPKCNVRERRASRTCAPRCATSRATDSKSLRVRATPRCCSISSTARSRQRSCGPRGRRCEPEDSSRSSAGGRTSTPPGGRRPLSARRRNKSSAGAARREDWSRRRRHAASSVALRTQAGAAECWRTDPVAVPRETARVARGLQSCV
jgi:hypothetical protein